MTTFYDHAGIRITERRLTVGGRDYPVGDLRALRMARGPGDRTTRRAAYLATLSLLIATPAGWLTPAPISMIMVVVLVAPPAVVAVVRARLVRPAYLLLADYRGRTVRLHETRDRTEFGKISRALLRVVPSRSCPCCCPSSCSWSSPRSCPDGSGSANHRPIPGCVAHPARPSAAPRRTP